MKKIILTIGLFILQACNLTDANNSVAKEKIQIEEVKLLKQYEKRWFEEKEGLPLKQSRIDCTDELKDSLPFDKKIKYTSNLE